MTVRAGVKAPDVCVHHERATLRSRLKRALDRYVPQLGDAPLTLLPDMGLAHNHIRLEGSGWIARVPKQSQMRLSASGNLAYQAACFERMSRSGHAPRLHLVLEPSPELPRGALIVEDIAGRPPRLPEDLNAIATALAQIHALRTLEAPDRPPLLDEPDPFAGLLSEVLDQAEHLDHAALSAPSRAGIERELALFSAPVASLERPEKRLISFDAHPGNFIIRDNGAAVLVDLEKARYSYPPLDLAHATLFTSTTWDVQTYAELSVDEITGAYARWAQEFGQDSGSFSPWHLPLRRGMWLWSVTWCAKWRVVSDSTTSLANASDGEDWSSARSDAALVDHVRDRVNCYLSAGVIERVRNEFSRLELMQIG